MPAPFDISLHEQVREEAIEWLIAFTEGEVVGNSRRRFDEWLKASPENVRAYLQVSAFWEAAGHFNRIPQELDDIIRRAAEESNVVILSGMSDSVARERVATRRPRRRVRAAMTAGFAALVAASGMFLWGLLPQVYATQVAEQRVVTLRDGSVVELSARTRMVVRFSRTERSVDLTEGQALFRVAKNPERPFVVRSGTAQVRAVGTEFDIDRKTSGTVVTVVEGKVSVLGLEEGAKPAATNPPLDFAAHQMRPGEVLLAAGDQVTVSPKAVVAAVKRSPAEAEAWRKGRLVFDSTPLADVVQAFNRYHAKPLTIDDPSLLSFHVSGTFSTTDVEPIVRFLAQRFSLRVREAPDAIRLSQD